MKVTKGYSALKGMIVYMLCPGAIKIELSPCFCLDGFFLCSDNPATDAALLVRHNLQYISAYTFCIILEFLEENS